MNRSLLCVVFLVVWHAGLVGSSKSSRSDDLYGNVYTETMQYTADILSSTYDWLAGSSNHCPFHENTMISIKENLSKHIKGQDEGLETILSAIAGWEFQRNSGYSEPLVLALTGPTGVGKSETAFRIAEGALAKRRRVGKSFKYLPDGLLTLRGEDYARGDIEEMHNAIRSRIVEHLEHCGGNAVIVFDEVQKVLPGTLEVLMPALESRGSISRTQHVPINSASGYSTSSTSSAQALLTSTATAAADMVQYVNKNLFAGSTEKTSTKASPSTDPSEKTRTKAVTTQHSTENVIFIFISDIGAEKMTKLVLTYGNRSAIPQTLLRSEIKSALDDQWARLRFGKVVREVVPYLPLEPEHIREILRTKLHNTGLDFQYTYWAGLVVDEDVVGYLSSPPLVKYSVYNVRAPAGPVGGGTKTSTKATGMEADDVSGATTAGVQTVECSAGAGAGGEGECAEASAPTASSGQGRSSAGASSAISSSGSATPAGAVTTKIFATWGARSLENAGPLQDLRGVLNRYAQPWRPDQVLHVGLVSEGNRELRNAKWGTQEKPSGTAGSSKGQTQLYVQWCKPHEMWPKNCTGGGSAADDHARPGHGHGANKPAQASPHPAAGDVNPNNRRAEPQQCTEAAHIITNDIAFSAGCETVWFGALVA